MRTNVGLVLLPAETSHRDSAISSHAHGGSHFRLSTRVSNLSLAVTALIRLRSRSIVS